MTASSGEHDPNRALHFSEGKSGVDQISAEVLLEWGDVFTYGEKKYARDNWLQGNDWHEFYGSVMRHLLAFWGGEDIDPESGLSHLSHAIWNLGALRYFQLHGLGEDDRPWLEEVEEPERKLPTLAERDEIAKEILVQKIHQFVTEHFSELIGEECIGSGPSSQD